MAGTAVRYPWSSAAAHCGNAANDRLIDVWDWEKEGLAGDWEQRLRAESASHRDEELRRATYLGLPLGDVDFVDERGVRLGRRLRPKPSGPAPKEKIAAAGSV